MCVYMYVYIYIYIYICIHTYTCTHVQSVLIISICITYNWWSRIPEPLLWFTSKRPLKVQISQGRAQFSILSVWEPAAHAQGALQYKLARTACRCVRGGCAVLYCTPNYCIEARKCVLVACCTRPLYCTAMYWIYLYSTAVGTPVDHEPSQSQPSQPPQSLVFTNPSACEASVTHILCLNADLARREVVRT